MSVNLSPPVVLGPWHSRPSPPSACRQHPSGESQGCPPASVQQGAPALRGEASRRFYSVAVVGGRIRTGKNHSQLVLRLPIAPVVLKGGGRLLRSPKSQALFPAHHTLSNIIGEGDSVGNRVEDCLTGCLDLLLSSGIESVTVNFLQDFHWLLGSL